MSPFFGPRQGTFFLAKEEQDLLSWPRKRGDSFCCGLFSCLVHPRNHSSVLPVSCGNKNEEEQLVNQEVHTLLVGLDGLELMLIQRLGSSSEKINCLGSIAFPHLLLSALSPLEPQRVTGTGRKCQLTCSKPEVYNRSTRNEMSLLCAGGLQMSTGQPQNSTQKSQHQRKGSPKREPTRCFTGCR